MKINNNEKKASQPPSSPKPTVFLLEYDHRFDVFSEFVFYDFMHPVKLPGEYLPTSKYP